MDTGGAWAVAAGVAALPAFAGFWFLIVSLLARLSGWGSLAERFPDRDDVLLERLRMQSGVLGKGSVLNPWGGVSYGNCLTLDVCVGGLRVSLWRIFGPSCRPFFVPWNSIAVETKQVLLFRLYRLTFGDGDFSRLTLYGRSFERIAAHGFLKAG